MLAWRPYNKAAIQKFCTYDCLLSIFFAIAILFLEVGIWLDISQPLLGSQAYSDLFSYSLPLFSVANKHYNNLKDTSFYKGVKKGYSIELLPGFIKKYYHNRFNKLFRIVGGIFTILVVSNMHLYLNFFFIDYMIMFISVLFLLQVLILNVIRMIYGIYLFIYKREVFQVKNSPVNVLATKWSMITICFKYGVCAPLAFLGTITTLGVVGDTIHVAAGGNPVFVPWVASNWKEVYKQILGVYPSTVFSVEVENSNINSAVASSSFLLFAGKKRLPEWLKTVLRILLIVVIILKLLGFGILNIFTDILSVKYFAIVFSSVYIVHLLINIYCLYYFYNNKNIDTFIEKFDFLPRFIISWLKGLKIKTGSKEYYKLIITSEMREVYLYTFIIIFFILVF